MPKVVLGVDAAWTEDNPSGVALAVEKGQGWRLVCVTPSYAHFEGRADAQTLPRGAKPDPAALLAAAERLAGAAPDLVAIDMPLSR